MNPDLNVDRPSGSADWERPEAQCCECGFVGLSALVPAADAWCTAALEAPHDISTPHPETSSIRAFDVVQGNAHEVCHRLWDVRCGIEDSSRPDAENPRGRAAKSCSRSR